MQLRQLVQDDDAVSPVIGVILMVAITVILAAVIGTFVLGLGDQVGNNGPSASIGFEFDNKTTVSLTHQSGARLQDDQLSVLVAGTTVYDGTGNTTVAAPGTDVIETAWNNSASSDGWGDEVTSGNILKLSEGAATTNDGETVSVVWTNGQDSSTLGEREWTV